MPTTLSSKTVKTFIESQVSRHLVNREHDELDRLVAIYNEEIQKDAADDNEKSVIALPIYDENKIRIEGRLALKRMTVGDDTRAPSGTMFRIERRITGG